MARPPVTQILALYRQMRDLNYGFKDVVVRTATDPKAIVPEVAAALRSMDAELPLAEVQTMEEHAAEASADARLTAGLLALFAALGTLLAMMGAYVVVSYLVARRTHEVGVRMALGVAGGLLTRRLLSGLLYGVAASDGWTLTGAVLLLVLVVGAASALPARRAMQVDPAQALRGE